LSKLPSIAKYRPEVICRKKDVEVIVAVIKLAMFGDDIKRAECQVANETGRERRCVL
jgi:hypothetical protein